MKYHVTDDAILDGATYSTICSQPDTPLAKDISKNMNIFAQALLEEPAVLQCGIHDSENDAIAFMKHPEIDVKWKDAYASMLATEVQDLRTYIPLSQAEQAISEADEALLERLCMHNCIARTAKNIVTYFLLRKHNIDDWLIKYINSFEKTIVMHESMFTQNEERDLCGREMIAADNIHNTQYQQIISSLHYYSYIPDSELGISKEKVDYLLESKVWRLHKEGETYFARNSEVVDIICNKYPDSLCTLASKFEKEFITCVLEKPALLGNNERITLQSANISDENKINILEGIEGTMPLFEADFSRNAQEYIVKNKFDPENLKDIIHLYCDEDVAYKPAIADQCVKHIDKIITNSILICYSLLIEILSSDLDEQLKVDVLLQNLERLSCEQVLLAICHIPTFKPLHDLRNGKRPKIPATPLADQLLSALKKQNIVSSESLENSMYIVYDTKKCSAND